MSWHPLKLDLDQSNEKEMTTMHLWVKLDWWIQKKKNENKCKKKILMMMVWNSFCCDSLK